MEKGKISTLATSLNDPKRLEILEHTGLFDSPPEDAFDRLTHLASETMEVPIALVSLVSNDRQFFKSEVGMCGKRETNLSHSFCKHVVDSAQPLVVPDARQHPLLRDNPAITDSHIIAYLGIPLTTAEGLTIGSFCAIDKIPRDWDKRDVRIMKDLASAVMTEVELRLLVRHFHANFLKLRNLEVEREELVQMLVHDLRNPLTSLLLGLHTLDTSDIPEPAHRCLGAAQRGAQHLSRMVTEILDVSKLKAGKKDLKLSDVSLNELLRSACELIAELATQSGVSLCMTVAAELTVKADADKIKRTMVNLLSNAVQHTPRGGKVNIVAAKNVRTKQVVIEIIDSGTGIPKEAFRQIFEKFNATQKKVRGNVASTGLGLPFCKMAVEAHGGHITVNSEVGKGTTFRIELPEVPPEPAKVYA